MSDGHDATSAMREAWSAYLCKPDKMIGWTPHGYSGKVLIASEALPAFDALNVQLERHSYTFDESAGGTYKCRNIAGTDRYSLHSYGIAFDINPGKNPQGKPLRTNIPEALRADIARIRLATGPRHNVFVWGGQWSTPDAMHFQVSATPAELKGGLTYPGQEGGPPPSTRNGDPAVTTYTVAKGDTLAHIAEANGLALRALIAVNPDIDPDVIRPGQVITIPLE